ncbi:hypothetical protein [Megamonas funiformis]|uniref:hypothetical protein n=1 Tax=Megamonas funiformis TaxID=437897 RepID=UPI00265CF090|nr:hypothetical protein [Megamonas funiformis]
MDILKDNIGLIGVLFVIVIGIGIFFWSKPTKQAEAQANKMIAQTDIGTVYIDTDNIEALKKDGKLYLIVSVEEHYKDSNFLTELRKGEDLQDVVSSLTLYMFTNDGRYYCTPQRYLIDSQAKVCADLGSNMQLQMIDDKVISKIYTEALRVLEDKQRFQNMVKN